MKQIIDFLPVVAFFGVWLATGRDIYYATAALMAAAVIQPRRVQAQGLADPRGRSGSCSGRR